MKAVFEENDSELDALYDAVAKGPEQIPERKIKFDVVFNRPNNYKPKEISFDEVDNYDFSKGFTEFIISNDYLHLYFDFDEIKNEEQFDSVMEWLEKVKGVFGNYSYGGYCNNDTMEELGFRRFDEGNHWLSMHVVFYETMISTLDLQTIMKHTQKKGFHTLGVHPLCDPNVYHLVSKKEGQTTRQLFRHVLADKIFRRGDDQNKMNHGYIIGNLPPSTQIVQVRGNEPIITKNQWSKLFTIKEDPIVEKKIKAAVDAKADANGPANAANSESKLAAINVPSYDPTDLNAKSEAIILSDQEIQELLSNFEPTYDTFKSIVSNLLHSPYEKNKVQELIESWYFTGEHQNRNTIENYLNSYYEKIESSDSRCNKWFFSIVKHIEDEQKRLEWRNKYISKGIDLTATIDMDDDFSFYEMRKIDYRLPGGIGVKVNKFISDLKRCVAVVDGGEQLFVVKDYDGVRDCMKLSYLRFEKFKQKMSSFNVGYYYKDNKKKTATAFTLYNEGENKNCLLKKGLRFYDDREDMLSYFVGYDYKQLEQVYEGLINSFLEHVKTVIANNNEELYEYILNWCSYIFQNPDGKTETCLVIIGEQGTGKNVFTNVLCKLLNRYANKNVANIDNIVGKFNTALENMKLVVCNEMSSAETNKYLNSDSLKAVITEDLININQKCEPVRIEQNVVNLIMVSNNKTPIKVEGGDRRYVVCEVSNAYECDFDYFEKLCNGFTKDFYDNLFTFFMKRDITKFNPRKLPETEAKKELIEASKSSYELFIQDNIQAFVLGWVPQEAFEAFKTWSDTNRFASCSSKTFYSNILTYCEKKRKCIDGQRIGLYVLKESKKQYFDLSEANEVV